MKFVPDAIRRKVADQALLGRKHSPTILLGAGVVSMVGSTVLACRATLKLEEVLERAQRDLKASDGVRDLHPDQYSEQDQRKDTAIIYVRGVVSVARLYAPAAVLGGVGVVCLTKSHTILKERNAALTAAYIAVDAAFKNYRQRVVDTFGKDLDREMRYGQEDVDIIDEETGKIHSTTRVPEGDPGMYARWFDETNNNWNKPPFVEHNYVFLRSQQNWANDMLHSRGHLFLNEVYGMLGLAHTSAGAIVGWVYKRGNEDGDNYVDFGCWDEDGGQPLEFFNGREGAILLDFNVDGPIWQLMDELNAKNEAEWDALQSETES
jgi:hypothetical protein